MPKWATAEHFTPWQKRWLKRVLIMLFVSWLFAGFSNAILLVSVEAYLVGRWGLIGKLARRVWGLRRVRYYRRDRLKRPNA